MSKLAWRRTAALLFAVAALVVFAVFRDYGVTWDEHFHDTYGKAVLRHFETGFSDPGALTYFNLWLYGAAFDVTTALAKRILPFADYDTQHLMIAMAGLAGAAAAMRMGALVGGPRAGVLSALLLLVLPSWWGHMFINPKDIPFASAMAWALYWSMRAASEAPAVRRSTFVWLGLSLGVSLGIRVAGAYAFVFPAFVFGWERLHRVRDEGAAGLMRGLWPAFRPYIGAAAIAYATMLVFWPWALRDPLHRPFEAIATFAASPWDIRVMFEGHLVSSMDLPRQYLLVYLGTKLPLAMLAALAASAFFALRALRAGGPFSMRTQSLLLAFAILLPLTTFPILRPITYDGIRHFLFVLPPLAVAAALGIAGALDAMANAARPARLAFSAVLVGALAAHIGALAAIHPYQYAFYNALVGGPGGAAGRFETDYWGSAYREAATALDAYVAKEGGGRAYTVFVCSEGSSAAPFLTPPLRLAKDDVAADFYLSTTRLGCDREYDGKPIIEIGRDGAVFALVKDRRALSGAARAHRPVTGALVAPRHPGLRRDGTPDPTLD
ncbi:MAG: hypothetical protein GC202_12165 [Alphaproteobacteria bacterium]|nr:hypothetical protein [Alphaproteobacteria bacterium]